MDRAQSPRPVGSKSPLSGLAAASLRELFLPPSSGQVATTTWMSPASPMTTIRLQWSVHNCISSDWLCSLFAHSHPLGSECTSGGWLAAGCCSAGCLNFYWGQTKKQKQKKKEGAWDEKQERIESMGPLLVVAARCVDAPEGTRGRTLKIQNY